MGLVVSTLCLHPSVAVMPASVNEVRTREARNAETVDLCRLLMFTSQRRLSRGSLLVKEIQLAISSVMGYPRGKLHHRTWETGRSRFEGCGSGPSEGGRRWICI